MFFRRRHKKKLNFQNELIELQNFKADTEQIWVASLDYTNTYLATGGKNGIVKIWKINTMIDDENKYIKSILNRNKEHNGINKDEIK